MDWKDTSRDKMEAVGCAGASITVKTELFLGLDEDVRTNWNRTSCLSRRICFSTKIQWHVGNVSSRSCCTSFAHFPRSPFRLRFIFIREDGTIRFNWFKLIDFIFLILIFDHYNIDMYSYMHFHMENIVVFLYYYIIMYRYIAKLLFISLY